MPARLTTQGCLFKGGPFLFVVEIGGWQLPVIPHRLVSKLLASRPCGVFVRLARQQAELIEAEASAKIEVI